MHYVHYDSDGRGLRVNDSKAEQVVFEHTNEIHGGCYYVEAFFSLAAVISDSQLQVGLGIKGNKIYMPMSY